MTREPVRVSSRDNALLVRLRRLARDGAAYRRLGEVWLEGDHLCRAALARGRTVAQALLAEYEDESARLVQIVSGAEADGAAFVLRQAIHPAARRAVERHLVAIAGEEVLAEVFAELLEEIAQPADDRIVAQDRVLFLRDVAHEHHHQRGGEREREQRTDAVRKDVLQHCPSCPSSSPHGGASGQ